MSKRENEPPVEMLNAKDTIEVLKARGVDLEKFLDAYLGTDPIAAEEQGGVQALLDAVAEELSHPVSKH